MRGQSARNEVWALVARQHGVVARRQLLDLGVTPKMIERRLASGRLHALWRGVYAVGRPAVTRRGWWMAATLACGHDALLSHMSAAELWGILETKTGSEEGRNRPPLIHVSVSETRVPRVAGIRVHRRRDLDESDRAERDGLPVTAPARTLIDLGNLLHPGGLEAAVNRADKLELIDPEALRKEVSDHGGMDGVKSLRRVLDRRTFTLTDSELERRFLRLVRRAGLPEPKTQQRVIGFRVDFYWPDLRLIVETDGLRYHRTPQQQGRDRLRDQTLIAAGFIVLRFTHAQVTFEPDRVVGTLRSVANSISVD
jgi:very-short-patch-repair endonuclease